MRSEARAEDLRIGEIAVALDDAECAADIERRIAAAGIFQGAWSSDVLVDHRGQAPQSA